MKIFHYIILTLAILGCTAEKREQLSNDVLIITHPYGFNNKNLEIRDTASAIRFSGEFWQYLLASHPRVAMTIFTAHRYKEHYPFYRVGDTAFAYFDIKDQGESFMPMLADKAGGTEKQDQGFRGTVWKNDPAGRPLPYEPKSRAVSETVVSEFDKFKQIVSDTGKHYIIVYRKRMPGFKSFR